MVQQSELWMDDDAICATCQVAFPAPPHLPKEIRGMIMCRPCGDFAWSILRKYASGQAPAESLDQIRMPKREMMRQATVDIFARNYARLTGKSKFKQWFSTNTIGPEKNPAKPAVDTFLEWVRNTYNQHRRAKPMGPMGVTAKLGDIATVVVETPPPPVPEVVVLTDEVTPLVKEHEVPESEVSSTPPSEKEKQARRKRSATQDAPAVPGAEVELSPKPSPKREAKKVKTAAEKLEEKIAKDKKKLEDRIAKGK